MTGDAAWLLLFGFSLPPYGRVLVVCDACGLPYKVVAEDFLVEASTNDDVRICSHEVLHENERIDDFHEVIEQHPSRFL